MQLAGFHCCRRMVQRFRDLRWRPVAVAVLLLVSLAAGVYLTRVRLQRRNWPSGRLPPVEAKTSGKHLGRYFLTGLKSAHTVAPGEEPYEIVASSHSVPGRGATRKLEAAEDGGTSARAQALSSSPSKVHSAVKAGASQIMDGWRAMRSAVLSSSARKLPNQAGSRSTSSKSPSFSSEPSGPSAPRNQASGKALLPSPPGSSSTAAHNTSSTSKQQLTPSKPGASLTPSAPAGKQQSFSKGSKSGSPEQGVPAKASSSNSPAGKLSKAEPKASVKQKGRSGHIIVDSGDVDSASGDGRGGSGPDRRSLPPSNHSLIVKPHEDGKLDMHPFWGSRVERDFRHWEESGITEEMVLAAADVDCHGDHFFFQIIDGVLYFKPTNVPGPEGWWPSAGSPGGMMQNARVPLTLVQILDVMHHFPGKVPDVMLAMQYADPPCIVIPPPGAGPPLPLLHSSPTEGHADITWPDFAYIGSEDGRLPDLHRGKNGPIDLCSWAQEYPALREAANNISFWDKKGQVIWRGRHEENSWRDHVRNEFFSCPWRLEEAGRPDEGWPIFNLWDPSYINTYDRCQWRYVTSLESEAWSSSLKFKMACGSVLIMPRPRFREWFADALIDGENYVEIPEPLCLGFADRIRDMEGVIRAHFEGNPEPAIPWTKNKPWEIAANLRKLVDEHIQMNDIRRYAFDVLQKAGSLQRFQHKPHPAAKCLSGNDVLEMFKFDLDRDVMLRGYPWLKGLQQNCKKPN